MGGHEGRTYYFISEALMVPLPVVVRHELVEGAEQPALSEQDPCYSAIG
jgi:hypothetical protein